MVEVGSGTVSRSFFDRASRKAGREFACVVHKKPARLIAGHPLVSFTFDDFPESALTRGGALLESMGVRGTYYASPGLAGPSRQMGNIASTELFMECVHRGHELGCHTFNHIDCAQSSRGELERNLHLNRELSDRVGLKMSRQFAYPYGSFDLSSKRLIAREFDSARTTRNGVNLGEIDLSALYSRAMGAGRSDSFFQDLIERHADTPGWLVFYTHDVSDQPSHFGCSVKRLASLVEACAKRSIAIATVGEVLARHVARPDARSSRQSEATF